MSVHRLKSANAVRKESFCERCEGEITVEGASFCPFCGEGVQGATRTISNALLFQAKFKSADTAAIRSQLEKLANPFGATLENVEPGSFLLSFNIDPSFGDDAVRMAELALKIRSEIKEFENGSVAFGEVSVKQNQKSRRISGAAMDEADQLAELGKSNEILVGDSFALLLPPEFQTHRPDNEAHLIGKIQFPEKPTPSAGHEKELEAISSAIDQLKKKNEGGSNLLWGPNEAALEQIVFQLRATAHRKDLLSFTLQFEEGADAFHRPFKGLIQSILSDTSFSSQRNISMWRSMLQRNEFWNNASYEELEQLLSQVLDEVASFKPTVLIIKNLDRANSSARLLSRNLVRNFRQQSILFLATSRKNFDGFATQMEVEGTTEDKPVRLHWDRLSLADQELVRKASIFGSHLRLDYLRDLTRENESSLLARLSKTGLFHFDSKERKLAFIQPHLQNEAYEQIDLSLRKAWHDQVADILLDRDASEEELAYHLIRGDRQAETMRFCLLAAKKLSKLPKPLDALSYVKVAESLARDLDQDIALVSAVDLRFTMESADLETDAALHLLEEWQDDPHFHRESWIPARFSLMRAKFLYQRERFEDALKEVKAAKEHIDEYAKTEVDLLHGRILARLGKYPDVVRAGLRTLKSSELTETNRGDFWSLLGYVAYSDKELQQATDFYEKSLESCRETDDLRGVKMALHNLGNITFVCNDYRAARQRYLQACNTSIKLGDPLGYCESLLNLGRANFALLRFEETLSNYDQAIHTFGDRQRSSLSLRLHLTLGTTLEYLGDLEQAGTELNAALVQAFRTKDPLHLGQTHRILALVERDRGNFEDAMLHVEAAIQSLADHPEQLQYALLSEIEILDLSGRRKDALEKFEQFEKRFAKENEWPDIIRLQALRLRSILSDRKNKESKDELLKAVKELSAKPLEIHILPVMIEALAYGEDKELKKQIDELSAKIREAFPKNLRKNFDQKPYIRSLSK